MKVLLKKFRQPLALLLIVVMVLSNSSFAFATDSAGNETEISGETDTNETGETVESGNSGETEQPEETEESKTAGENNADAKAPALMSLEDDLSSQAVTVNGGSFLPYIKGFSFVDGDGNPFTESNPVKRDSFVTIQYDFELPNDIDIPAGSVFTLPAVPDHFEMTNLVKQTIDLQGEALDKVNKPYWNIGSDNIIYITFPKEVTVSNISGFLQLNCQVDAGKFNVKVIHFDLGDIPGVTTDYDTDYKPVIVNPSPEVKKSAVSVDADGMINWKITVTPSSGDTVDGYILTDEMSDQTYVNKSMRLDGETEITPEITTRGWKYTFGTGLAEGDHTITYKTSVSDAVLYGSADKKSVNNKIQVKNPDTNTTAEATAQSPVRDVAISKTADTSKNSQGLNYEKVGDKYYLNYVVKVKYQREGKAYAAQIQDKLPEGLALVPDSLKIKYAEADTPADAVNQGTGNQITVNLDSTKTEAWLYYKAEITDFTKFQDGDNYVNNKVTNTASLYLDTKKTVDSTYNWSIGIGVGDGRIEFTKSGAFHKNNNGENTITWTITINDGAKDVTADIDFIDYLLSSPQGTEHEYIQDSFKVMYGAQNVTADTSKVSGFTVGGATEYTVPGGGSKNALGTLACTLKGLGTKKCVITYETKVTKFALTPGNLNPGFDNDAQITVQYQGAPVVEYIHRYTQPGAVNAVKKSGTYNYETKQFDWTINVNSSEVALHNLKVTDTLPTGHTLADGSLKVNGDAITDTVSTTVPYYEVDGTGVYVIHFPGTTGTKQVITLSTVPDTEITEETQKISAMNMAAADADEIMTTISSNAKVDVNFEVGLSKKTNYKSGDKVEWEVVINNNKAVINKQGAELTDTLPPGLVYKDGSAKLYLNGKTEIALTAENVSYDSAHRTLKVILPDNLDLSQSYTLKFTTNVISYTKGIMNTITFNGSATESKGTSTEFSLISQNASSAIIGDNICFELTKTDADGAPLEGAEYGLYDSNKKQIQKKESAADGMMSFDAGLRYGTDASPRVYYYKEIKAPAGYALDETYYEVTIGAKKADKTASVTVNKTPVIITDVDQNGTMFIPAAALDEQTVTEISKVAATGGAEIPGAYLEVYDADDQLIDDWTSEAGVVHRITGLTAGATYTLKETQSPDGYTIAADVTFTVKADGTVTSVEMVDEATTATISKRTLTGSDELTGAKLTVKAESGDVVDSWISGEDKDADDHATAHTISGLIKGTYTLTEEGAPAGYQYTDKITFTVGDNGVITSDAMEGGIIVMRDAVIPEGVKISKTDISGENEVPGAELTLYKVKSGDETADTKVDNWTSGTAAYTIPAEKLTAGETYRLHEDGAPAGYAYTADVTFSLDKTGAVIPSPDVDIVDGVVQMRDEQTTVSFSKEDIENAGTELPGAVLTIYKTTTAEDGTIVKGEMLSDKDGNAVSWESTDKKHVITGVLEADTTYILEETTAPDGYTYHEDMVFSIERDGTVHNVNDTVMKDSMTNVSISKKAIDGEDELPGATLTIYEVVKNEETGKLEKGAAALDRNGKELQWISTDKEKVLKGDLKADHDYILEETDAPDGYAFATDIAFHIEKDGSVTAGDKESQSGIVIEDKLIRVSFSKEGVEGAGKELPGATITIYKTNDDGSRGEEVTHWISTSEKHEVLGLNAGETYILEETTAPAGYTCVESKTFRVERDGTVAADDTVMKDTQTVLGFTKTDMTEQNEIPGALLTVYEKNEDGSKGEAVTSWTSEKEAHVLTGELSVETDYILEETGAPDGYAYTADIEFSLERDGTLVVADEYKDADGNVMMKDETTKVTISKQDLTDGKELEGAKLEVKDAEGEIIDSWISGEDGKDADGNVLPHQINGVLIADAKYTLTETTAPTGYNVAETITFTVNRDGEVQTVTMKDERKTGTVRIEKSDRTNAEHKLGNAAYALYMIVSENGKADPEKDTLITEVVTDKNGMAEVSGLDFGAYYFKETSAPDGFVLNPELSKIFVISAANVETEFSGEGITVIKTDDDTTKVTISKVAITGGKELPGAKLQVIDKDGNIIEEWISTDKKHEINGILIAGAKYTLREITAPDGYAKATDITFTVNTDGKVQTVEMVDEKLASKPGVKTGDNTPIAAMAVAMVAAIIAIEVILSKRKKRN